MAKAKWVSEETPEVGNESFGEIIAFGITLALAVIISKGIGWIFKKLEEGVKKLGEKIEKHKEATTGINGYVLELKKREPHLKEVLAKLHKPVSVMTKDQILQMLTSMVDNKYHEVLTHLNDRVLKSPEAIAAIALMCHNTVEPGYLKRIVNNPQFAKEPLIYGFIANSGLKVYATLSWHDGMYRNQGTKLSKVAMDIAARLTTIYKGAEELVDGPYIRDPLHKYLRKHKSEIESLYKKADAVWNEVCNLYYDKSYIIDAHEKDYDTIDVFNKDALTLGHVLCDLSTIEHILQAETAAFNTFKEKAQFLYNLNFAKSSLQSHELDLDSKGDQDSEIYEAIETLLGTMYAMVHTLGHVGYEHEYASEEILGASQHVLACYNALDKIVAKLESKVPSVALEGWFSSKTGYGSIEDSVNRMKTTIETIDKFTRENNVIANYHKLVKEIHGVKLPANPKEYVLKLAAESYDEKIESISDSEFSTPEKLFAAIIVSKHPCQEDYNQGYVCLKNLVKSSAYHANPLLTAIFSQCGCFDPQTQHLLDGGKRLEAILNKVIESVNDKKALEAIYDEYWEALKIERWSYCMYGSPLEKLDGIKLVDGLSKHVPLDTLKRLQAKATEVAKADNGKANKIVVKFLREVLDIFNDVREFYLMMHYHTEECNKIIPKIGNEAFADFASETQQVTDFANRYRDEHMLDESYHKINIDAKGSISHQAWISEKGIGNMYEQIDDAPMLDFVALESEGGEGKSLIARLIEKIKQFFIWLAKKVGIYREQEEKVDLGDIKKKHDDIEDQVRKCQSDVVNVKDFKESLRSEAIAKLRMSTQDQKLACYLLDTHYKQADKDTLASIFNTARIWNINPVAAAGLAIIGPYQTVKHYPIISEAIKSLEVIIDSLVKAADTVASNGNGANITALSRLPKVDIDALQSLRQSLSKVYSLENIKDADSDIIKDKDVEQVFSDISNFDKLINKFDGAVEHVTVTLNKLNGNAVKNNDIELEEIGKWLNYTATLVANMISIFNGYRQVFQHQWSWLRRYEQLLIVKYKPAAEGWAGVANQEVQDEDQGMSDLLDMESDTEDFDIEMDNETLGVDDLEDYVSNDVEPAQTEVAVGLEHYGELIATKGMCKEYYVACESLQPGIFSGIQQNRLTALPSRTMQAVALEAVEGEQKKGLIARLIEKIKQFFKWILSKLGFAANKSTQESKIDPREVEELAESERINAEAAAEMEQMARKIEERKKEYEQRDNFHNSVSRNTTQQKAAFLVMRRRCPPDKMEIVSNKTRTSPAWKQHPLEFAAVVLFGTCHMVKYDPYLDTSIKILEENLEMVLKLSNIISSGTVDQWDFKELEKVSIIDAAKMSKISAESVTSYTVDNLDKFTGGLFKNKDIDAVSASIVKYQTITKRLKDKLESAQNFIENTKHTPSADSNAMSTAIFNWIGSVMSSMTMVNNVVRKYTHALIMQQRWTKRVIARLGDEVFFLKEMIAAESFVGWAQPAPMPQSWCIPAMEAIDFQYKSKLFTRLTEEISEIRKRGVFTTKAFLESNIVKIINEETNLQYTLRVYHSSFPDAAVCNFVLDKNNPLIDNEGRPFLSNINLENVKALLGAKTNGWIDYTRGKVGGVFAKIQNSLHVTTGIVADGIYTDEEVAAIFCHEIGHTFTAYSQIANVIGMNYIIQDISDRLKGVADRTVAIDIIHEYDTRYGIKLPAEEITAVMENETKMVTKLVVEVSKWRRNAEGDYVFSARNSEMVADQFAARMGAGRAVVTGLDKMERHYGLSDQYQSRITHVMSQTFSVLIRLVISLAIPPALIFFILGVWLDNPQKKTYDDPIERYTRVRNETIVGLKNSKITSEMKKVLLEDIAEMDRVIKLLNNQKPWFEWIWDNIFPSGKKTVEAMKFQQLIERMGNNDLFMKSASYELLIEDLKNA